MILKQPTVIAQDLSINIYKTPEIYDIDVIESSIENLLVTATGERFFDLNRGTSLIYKVFELQSDGLEEALNNIASKIQRYIPQIIVIEPDMRIRIEDDMATITIPYIVKDYNLKRTYSTTIKR